MENSKKIIDWTLKNRNHFKLEVIYYRGLEKYFPDLFDIGLSIEHEGKKFKGRGSDKDETVAYLKAFSECIERIATFHYKLDTTNGLAAHYNIENAKVNAFNELIERDSFMCHFLLRSNFNRLSYESRFKQLDKTGIKIEYFEMCRTDSIVAILVLATGSSASPAFGLLSGTACDKTENKAIAHAEIEMLRNLDHILECQKVDDITIENFNQIEYAELDDHGKLSKNVKYAKEYASGLKREPIDLSTTYCKDDFQFEEIDLRFIANDIPIKLVRSLNPKLQGLFTGPTREDKLNLSRLSYISKTEISMSVINRLPHPFD